MESIIFHSFPPFRLIGNNRLKIRCSIILYTFLILGFRDPVKGGPDIKNGYWNNIKRTACDTIGRECCLFPHVRLADAIPKLKKTLSNEFFGQHIALQTVIKALDAHVNDKNPSKALVLSFHGWAGSGKTYLAQHIRKALYSEGEQSKFTQFFISSHHFPDPNKVMEYQEDIRFKIQNTVARCDYALFIFDEVDKTPPGVFDAVSAFIQHPGLLDGRNYKHSIFIFMSNTGSNAITARTLRAWKEGKRREDLTFWDFQNDLSKESFNEANGLYKSSLIDKILIDYFIPFLPMERKHVIECANLTAKQLGIAIDSEEVADQLTYWPADLKIYSQTGCKRVETYIKYEVASQRYGKPYDEDEELYHYEEDRDKPNHHREL